MCKLFNKNNIYNKIKLKKEFIKNNNKFKYQIKIKYKNKNKYK